MGFHIVKRDNCPFWKRCCLYLAAVVVALLIGAAILTAIDVDPWEYYYQMFTMGTVGNKIAYKRLKLILILQELDILNIKLDLLLISVFIKREYMMQVLMLIIIKRNLSG